MTTYTATITRSKDQPLGIGLKNHPIYGLIISSIAEEGALGESCLKKGMKLRTINNIDVSGLSSKEAVKILKGTEGKLIISAEKVMPSQLTFETRVEGGVTVNGVMTADINAMPTILIEAGVPSSAFSRINKLVEKDLLPAALALRRHELTVDRDFGSYFNCDNHHVVGSMFAMVLKSSHLERNVDLKALQVSMLANAVLAKYNLMSTIAVGSMPTSQAYAWTKYDRLKVMGLMFYKIE